MRRVSVLSLTALLAMIASVLAFATTTSAAGAQVANEASCSYILSTTEVVRVTATNTGSAQSAHLRQGQIDGDSRWVAEITDSSSWDIRVPIDAPPSPQFFMRLWQPGGTSMTIPCVDRGPFPAEPGPMECTGARGIGDTALGVLVRFNSGNASSSQIRLGPSARPGEGGGSSRWAATVTGEEYWGDFVDFGIIVTLRLWIRGESVDIACTIAP